MKDPHLYVQKGDDDYDYPPTIEGEIDRLNKQLNNFKNDNIYKLFFSVNRKAGEIADALNDADLSLKAEDKVFDRFLKLIDKLEPLVKTLSSLRQDYLKVSEEEVPELEKKGIPPLERRAKTKRNG